MDLKELIDKAVEAYTENRSEEEVVRDLPWFEIQVNRITREHFTDPVPPWITFRIVEDGVMEVGVADPEETRKKAAELAKEMIPSLDVLAVDPKGFSEPCDPDDIPYFDVPIGEDGKPDMERAPCVFVNLQGEIGPCAGIVSSVTRQAKVEGGYSINLRLCEEHRRMMEDGGLDDLLDL